MIRRYNPKLKLLARELRRHSTLTEVLLWKCFSQRQRHGFNFHRQTPVDEYILDFFAPELSLAIEIDGGSHRLKGPQDERRKARLEALGIRFLRFNDATLRTNLESVVRAIDDWIVANAHTNSHTPALRATPLERGFQTPNRSVEGKLNAASPPKTSR